MPNGTWAAMAGKKSPAGTIGRTGQRLTGGPGAV
jgi:hypothetical protein